MEIKPVEKKGRERGVIYLAPNVWRWLRHRKADTRESVGEIIEGVLKPHINHINPDCPKAQ